MRHASVLCLCLLVPAAAAAQTSTSAPLTLDEAIAHGLANSQRLAELQSRAEAADFAIAGRRAAERPLVALQGGYTRTNHVDEFAIALPGRAPQVVYPDIPDNYRARLDLQWPIYTGGRADALERAARAERSAIASDVDAARADLRLEITRAYWAAVTAGETEAVLRRSLEAVDAHVSDVRARLAAGVVPPNDVASAEAQASHQRLLALEAANQRAIAEADLARLTGRDTVTVAPAAAADRPAAPALPATAALVTEALRARAERHGLEQRAASADARAAAAAAAGRPQIGIGGGYDYARPNPRIFPRARDWKTAWDASFNVSWTLWDGGRRAAEHGEASAAAAALRTRVTEFDRQVTFEVRARALELESSRQAVVAADDGVRAAVEAERVVGERYRAGVLTSTEVLDALIARLQAELDRTRAIAGVRLAEARLERAVGRK
ncbi:MAG TPA: TolC family protein [Vicinamibacterales bacterium]|nr:TolC family protein [Vicinamibacterales bacterium]